MTRSADDGVVLVSAHRCGAGLDVARENTAAALLDAARSAVDLVEFDVQRCGDGTYVVRHDEHVVDPATGALAPLGSLDVEGLRRTVGEVLTLDELLVVLAEHRKGAHLDLKVVSPSSLLGVPAATHEVQAVERAVGALGADRVVVTSRHAVSVAAVREWARDRHPDLLVGLSLGGRRGSLVRDLFARRALARSRANLVVAQHWHARLGLARLARRHGLALLVWTIDHERRLRYWLRPGRAWLVTSNVPERALAIRASFPVGPSS